MSCIGQIEDGEKDHLIALFASGAFAVLTAPKFTNRLKWENTRVPCIWGGKFSQMTSLGGLTIRVIEPRAY